MTITPAVPQRFGVACLLMLALSVGAQEPHRAAADQQKSQEPVYRVNVRLVNVFTTVTDSHGAPIADLAKDDFKIFEDGQEQDIRVFERESELPLSIVLAVDTSPSTERDFKLEVVSAKKFARSIVRPVDRLSVFQVTANIDQVTPFTPDLRRIDRGIDALHVGPGTSLYDAIFLSSEALMDREGRKVLVLITDGGDTTSKADYQAALKRAQQAEAIVYSIIVVPVEADAGRNLGGEHALIQISKDTGGKYYYAESVRELDDAFQQVSKELRTQYLIAYYPSRKLSDSPFRRIKVEVAKKDPDGKPYLVRHRAGYFTAPAK
ncbi:MAG TPA: VWA domain-containing protein [Candidatus Limnocylindrales bacterium]|jgi:Ca-activated chloride channel family protein|nr:VWA domain-containing protein [Candidatus Limnocylindrales bacterium]